MAHTPGPWGQIEVGNSIGIVPLGKNGKPRDGRSTEDICALSTFEDDARSNARLIAAAPDLEANLILSTRFLEIEAEGHRMMGNIKKAEACEGQAKQNRAVLLKVEDK